jgi:hypothetical protein
MLKKKIKSIFVCLAGEMVDISYICLLTNESEKKVLRIIAQLEKEKFIK